MYPGTVTVVHAAWPSLQQARQDFPNNEGLANPPYPIQTIANLLQEQQVPLANVATPQIK